jgi:hypothetical protein
MIRHRFFYFVWLLAVLSLLSTLTSFARLNETFEQSEARYGAPINGSLRDPAPDCRQAEFWENGFLIRAHFLKSLCVELTFMHEETKPTTPSASDLPPFCTPSLTNAEALVLLTRRATGSHGESGRGKTWMGEPMGTIGVRGDRAMASLSSSFQTLRFETPEADDYRRAVACKSVALPVQLNRKRVSHVPPPSSR